MHKTQYHCQWSILSCVATEWAYWSVNRKSNLSKKGFREWLCTFSNRCTLYCITQTLPFKLYKLKNSCQNVLVSFSCTLICPFYILTSGPLWSDTTLLYPVDVLWGSFSSSSEIKTNYRFSDSGRTPWHGHQSQMLRTTVNCWYKTQRVLVDFINHYMTHYLINSLCFSYLHSWRQCCHWPALNVFRSCVLKLRQL